MLKRKSKGAHIESERGKDDFHIGDKSSTGCEDSLCFGKEVFQAQSLFLMQPREG